MASQKKNSTGRGTPLSRRDFLVRSGLVGAGALSMPALLAACGGGGSGDSEAMSLMFENWPLYIDEETVALFKSASGIDLK